MSSFEHAANATFQLFFQLPGARLPHLPAYYLAPMRRCVIYSFCVWVSSIPMPLSSQGRPERSEASSLSFVIHLPQRHSSGRGSLSSASCLVSCLDCLAYWHRYPWPFFCDSTWNLILSLYSRLLTSHRQIWTIVVDSHLRCAMKQRFDSDVRMLMFLFARKHYCPLHAYRLRM